MNVDTRRWIGIETQNLMNMQAVCGYKHEKEFATYMQILFIK